MWGRLCSVACPVFPWPLKVYVCRPGLGFLQPDCVWVLAEHLSVLWVLKFQSGALEMGLEIGVCLQGGKGTMAPLKDRAWGDRVVVPVGIRKGLRSP